MELSQVQILERWNQAFASWNDNIQKYTLIDIATYEYEKHLKDGEDWNAAFRFPEIFGSVQRKYDTVLGNLPEVRIKDDDDGGIALQGAYDCLNRKANKDAAMARVMFNTIWKGMGVLFVAPTRFTRKVKVDGKEKDMLLYDGLGYESVDPRDFFPAHSAVRMHDHTGGEYCPYVFRRRIYFIDTFKQKFSGSQFKDVEKVQGTSWGQSNWSDTPIPSRQESKEKIYGNVYVTVLEYWDQENDILKIYANGIEIFDSPDGIPYSHKQIPFHIYYNYRKADSMSGISEVELIMPYNQFRETIINLVIDNAKLELNQVWIVDGDINFNPEDNELEPGGIFTVSGLAGGKLQDHMMPFRAGGMTADIPNIMNMVEDSQIVVTADDKRALFQQPGQLATQTLAKQQTLQKRLLSQLTRNTTETEYYLALQIISLIQNELSESYLNEDDKPTYREIDLIGFNVIQDKDESDVVFMKGDRQSGKFRLNPKVAKMTKDKEIEVVPAAADDEANQNKLQAQAQILQTLLQLGQLAQTSPDIAKLLSEMDVGEYIKQTLEALKYDTDDIFPKVNKENIEFDEVNNEHDAIMLGVVPDIKPEEDSKEHLKKHREFEKSAVFKRAGKKQKSALQEHLLATIQNIIDTITNAAKNPQPEQQPQLPAQGPEGSTSQQGAMGVPSAPQQQGAVSSVPGMAQGNQQAGGTSVLAQEASLGL
jgi:hypothetical protein